MKYFALTTLFLLIVTSAFSQKVISDKGEIKDLKDVTTKYTQVTFQGALNKLNVAVETDSEGYWRFYDIVSNSELKFVSHAAVMNFMYKNGWVFKQFTQSSNAPVSDYIFEKKE